MAKKKITKARVKMGMNAVKNHLQGALRIDKSPKPFAKASHVVIGNKMHKVK